MAESGLESTFIFLSYKLDNVKLSILRDIGVLRFEGNYTQYGWNQNLNIRIPVYFAKEKIYVCAVDTILELRPPKVDGKESDKWLTLEVGIAGLFSTQDRMEKDLEKKFVAITAPAILFPFLRAACSNILASAGFGSVIIPLVNMYRIGEKFLQREDFAIQVIE